MFDYYVTYSKTCDIFFQNYCAEPITKEANDAKNFGECRIPKINPFHPDAMALIKKYERPLNCIVKKRVTLSGGKLEIFGEQNTALEVDQTEHCSSNIFHVVSKI